MLLNFIHPVLNGTEALSVSDVIGYNDSMGSFVIAASNCFKSFLACSVPLENVYYNIYSYNLELDCFPIDLDSSDFLEIVH